MKLMIALATLAFAAVTNATPLVGDYSNFNLTMTNGTDSMVGSYEIALVNQNGSNYTMTTTVKFDNQPAQHNQETVAAADLISDQVIQAVLAQCSSQGGKIEQLTVPAGTFTTCAIPTADENNQPNGVIYIGQVPFGIVKQTQKRSDGLDLILELKQFVNGK